MDYQTYANVWRTAYYDWLKSHETFQRWASRPQAWVDDYRNWSLRQARLHADAAIAAARAEGTL